ncbi:MAG: B12-binding domain-containing radical SAM protein [Betaproteobacteria bacterium]|nr:B12-binding domain-containing radical SAM protein [Betaproteobacteria bacterium]
MSQVIQVLDAQLKPIVVGKRNTAYPAAKHYSKKILLVWPGKFGAFDPDFPNSCFYLAKALMDDGWEPSILDMQIEDYKKIDYSQYLFVGISSMSGPQLGHARTISSWIREVAPGCPIVYGGDHVNTEDESTVRSKFADYAIRGEGEIAIVQLANSLYEWDDIGIVNGLTAVENGNLIRNEKGDFVDFGKVNHLPYYLVDIKKYPGITDKFPYLSSKGCPFTCAFCTWKGNRKMRIKSPEVVIEEIEHIVKNYGPKTITFIDGLFYVQVKRVKEIARLAVERKLDVSFYSMCRVDLFEKVDDEMLRLLKAAHFDEIAFGGESGSDLQLKLMSKNTTAKQLLKSAERTRDFGIMPTYSFLLGLPGELDEHVPLSLKIIDELKKLNPVARCNIMAIFDPYPGADYTDQLIAEKQYEQPTTFEEWCDSKWLELGAKRWIPKAKGKDYLTLQALVRYFYVWDTLNLWPWEIKVARHNGSRLFAIVSYVAHGLLWPIAKMRWKFGFFKFGFEINGWRKLTVMMRGHD